MPVSAIRLPSRTTGSFEASLSQSAEAVKAGSPLFLFIQQMKIGQHALMKDADDADAIILFPIEYDMTPLLHAHQSRADGIAIPP